MTFKRIASLIHKFKYSASIFEFKSLAVMYFRCPLCGPSLLLRIAHNAIGVRCIRCGSSSITMSLVSVINSSVTDIEKCSVYEMSSRGSLHEFLRNKVLDFTCSEYFDEVSPGEYLRGVQCQDVQALTYDDESFDLCTSTEVFEHVPKDIVGFSEVRRVMKKNGMFIFTVPLMDACVTIERVVIDKDRKLRYLAPPAYHDDHIRGNGQVLVYRDYGVDITERLRSVGFSSAAITTNYHDVFLGTGCKVIIAVA